MMVAGGQDVKIGGASWRRMTEECGVDYPGLIRSLPMLVTDPDLEDVRQRNHASVSSLVLNREPPDRGV
ncbi:hypothetical protein F2P79_021062 [Pimephales promelas]|nr:hypothetical protein F2P79_021062 [Pimephales promelas]